MTAAVAAAVERFERRAHFLGLSSEMTCRAVASGLDGVRRLCNAAESPIERALAPWLVFEDYPGFLTIPARVHLPAEDKAGLTGDVSIVPQLSFGRFRLDFVVVGIASGRRIMCAVECDGRDFHDRERDAERDQYLRTWGIETVRANGQAIHANPQQVSARVADALMRAASRP